MSSWTYRNGKIKRICKFCGKNFIVFKSRLKQDRGIYCSKKCSGKAHAQDFKGRDLGRQITKKCFICGKDFITYKSQNCVCCSDKCRGLAHSDKISRENHPNWQGGIGKLPYPFNFNEELKELIRKRDNYKCQICGCPQEECYRKLDVHHKDGDKNNLNPDNLISLCQSCHIKLERKNVKTNLAQIIY